MQRLNFEFLRSDKRGALIQVNTGKWKQLNHLIIRKGQTFGGHYHKHKKELFYCIRGFAHFIVLNHTTNKRNMFSFKKGDCLLIEPYDNHILHALVQTEIIELLSEPYDEGDVWIKRSGIKG